MANKDPKPVLGYRHCPDCDTRATVHQASGTRRQLYQRCECGADQRNGRLVQSRLWYETQWLPDLKPADPPAQIYALDEYQAELAKQAGRYSGLKSGLEADEAKENSALQGDAHSGLEAGIEADSIPDSGQSEAGPTPTEKRSRKGWLWWLLLPLLGGLAWAFKQARA